MKVAELIEQLKTYPPDSEVHICSSEHGIWTSNSVEVGEVFESTATYGLLLPEPRTVNTVVLDVGGCGL